MGTSDAICQFLVENRGRNGDQDTRDVIATEVWAPVVGWLNPRDVLISTFRHEGSAYAYDVRGWSAATLAI